jgi:hypothetical protein
MDEVIKREEWNSYVKEFNERNGLRATRVEILSDELGDQEQELLLPLLGISLEEKGKDAPSIEVSLGGETAKEERHLTHMIPHVRNIMRKIGVDLREEALMIEDEEGTKTILHFQTLPELEPAV